ncbi:MAG: phospholipase [Acidimicrobiales bacterium]|jgi:hypothetical protein
MGPHHEGTEPHLGHHPPEARLGPSATASVVLDIGAHAGALVLRTGATLDGAEIEIRPAGGPWQGAHSAVRQRHVRGTVVHAAVFGSLGAGAYDVRVRGGDGPAHPVAVVAGAVTDTTFEEAPVAPVE